MTPSTGPSSTPLPKISYQIAYYLLPRYAFRHREALLEMFRTQPETTGPFFYELACQEENLTPNSGHAHQFHPVADPLDETRDYFLLKYPEPAPIDLSGVDMERLPPGAMPVHAPFYSAVVIHQSTDAVQYFVLGQAPLGGTTLRSVAANGRNTNLGHGPEPSVNAFLEAIRRR